MCVHAFQYINELPLLGVLPNLALAPTLLPHSRITILDSSTGEFDTLFLNFIHACTIFLYVVLMYVLLRCISLSALSFGRTLRCCHCSVPC